MPSLSQLDEEEKKTLPVTDFRSRYAAETKGMPVNLAAVAAQNLGAQDAALAKVNAVARMLPQQPDYSLPTSDFGPPTSSAPASISDLHTDDIATRRAAIDEQKLKIQERLGIVLPRPGTAVVLAGPHERKELLQNWTLLEKENDNLLREHHQVATLTAKQAHENFIRQKHVDSATEFSSFMKRLQEVRKTTKRGTPEREEAIINAHIDFPSGSQVPAARNIALQMAKEQETAALITAPPGYETVPGRIGATGKISYDLKPKGTAERLAIEAELKEKYGLTPAQIKAPEKIESGNMVDGQFVGANKGTHFKVKGKGDEEYFIPREEFKKFGGHIGLADETEPTPAGPASATAAPDLKAIAQKALNDPNASEAHKAAARKLLGQ